jgi:hypothetical protein
MTRMKTIRLGERYSSFGNGRCCIRFEIELFSLEMEDFFK